ncbi:MAG: hypothetical protein J6X94_09315 [Lachnospiraceae bacterium]|nr:hypothetical protein [Lachnospiraceae bacterium]
MSETGIDRKFYEAIVRFEESEEAQDYYYKVMETKTGRIGRDGREETIKDRILKAYGLLFCEDTGLKPGQCAGPDEVTDTADRLYLGSVGFDSEHWYRMKYHFPVIDDDNYDRFAALVISDLHSGPLHDAAQKDRKMLIVGEADPIGMTKEHRRNQKTSSVVLPGGDR